MWPVVALRDLLQRDEKFERCMHHVLVCALMQRLLHSRDGANVQVSSARTLPAVIYTISTYDYYHYLSRILLSQDFLGHAPTLRPARTGAAPPSVTGTTTLLAKSIHRTNSRVP